MSTKKYPLKFYFKLFALHLKINGLRWTMCFSVRHVLTEMLRVIERITQRLEAKYHLPGTNSIAENNLKWNMYRWERGENEWTPSEEWKEALIEEVMLKNISPDHVVLEIGPGFGRWTRKLIEISRRVIVVDVTEKCIDHCRQLFRDKDNIEFHINDGRSLDAVSDNSIDFIWSFDVFVHIEPEDIECYLIEFQRILKEGGLIIIHHGIVGRTDLNWRSSLTLKMFLDLLDQHKFTLVEQLTSWGEGDEFKVAASDTISIFKKS